MVHRERVNAPDAVVSNRHGIELGGKQMTPRTIEEIEKVFRDLGLTEETWGRRSTPEAEEDPSTAPQIFIRIETTTTPVERKSNADLA